MERLQTFSLALLLFYAGLKTDIQAIRGFLKYGLVLAIAGVAISTLVLGAAIVWLTSQSGSAITPDSAMPSPWGQRFLWPPAWGQRMPARPSGSCAKSNAMSLKRCRTCWNSSPR